MSHYRRGIRRMGKGSGLWSRRGLGVAVFLTLLALPSFGLPVERPYAVTEEREPCRDYDPLRRPFFGDTHVHTSFSHDASTQGTRNTPRDAYRFAQGQELGIQPFDEKDKPQRRVKLDRPLDWTALSDHAEMLGEVRICSDPEHSEYDSDVCWNKRNAQFALLGFLARSQVGRTTQDVWTGCGAVLFGGPQCLG